MMTPVQLRRADAVQRETQAWFLAGGDPAAWLAEVSRWRVPAETLRFFPLAEPGGVDVAGVLVVLPEGAPPLEDVRGQPFGRVAPDFFAPVEARLSPPMSAEELRAAARFPVLVFHPALGLTGFENAEGARVTHWLAAPLATSEDWTAARHGAAERPLLRSLHLQADLSLAQIFGEESKDIGSQSDQLPPPKPGEAKPGPLTGAAQKALLGGGALLAKGLLKLTSLAPTTASAPTWINKLENWLGGMAAGPARDLLREREKEIERLLHLLKTDPELGLKFALPLAALLGRGTAQPGSQLGQRSTDFNLQRLGGGRATDSWELSAATRASLAQSYREQAMRELRLGRHRRAAYIFAELLGDLAAAADALKQGKHFLEAAVLYRDRLHNPIAAAQCLAEAGKFPEALALYEKHERWMDAADLYAKLGDRAGEERSVRRVVAAYLKGNDTLAAARLIDSRLRQTDEALDLLAQTWPGNRQAIACLEERFAILHRVQRPAAIEELLHELTAQSTPTVQLAPLANVLAKLAENGAYEARLRRLAAEGVRVKVSLALTGRTVDSSDELAVLRALTRTAPGDKLLARDTLRFRAERQKPPPPELKTVPKTGIVPRLKVTLSAGPGSRPTKRWLVVQTVAEGFVALGSSGPDSLDLVDGSWTGRPRHIRRPLQENDNVQLAVANGTAVLGRSWREPMTPLPAVDGLPSLKEAGVPVWLPENVGCIAASGGSVWVLRSEGFSGFLLECFHEGKLRSSRNVQDEYLSGEIWQGMGVQRNGQGVALGMGRWLLHYEEKMLTKSELDSRVIAILPAPSTTPGWIVSLERGLVFVSLDGATQRTLDSELESPRVTILRLGEIVAVSGTRGFVYRLQPDRVEIVGSFELGIVCGCAIVATNELNEFASFDADGAIHRWRISN